jgi:small subunit ribosomal protein S7
MAIKVFDKWEVDSIKVEDPGLVNYINLSPTISPKTGGKNTGTQFHKSKTFIVERLINKVMNPGHKSKKHMLSSGNKTGKGVKAYDTVEKMLTLIEGKTKENPIKVLVKAIENAAPREEILTIEYGGARYPKAVECAPQRRVDIVLKLMTQGAFQKSFNKKKPVEAALADEVIAAYQMSANSAAIQKKLEVERQADSSR